MCPPLTLNAEVCAHSDVTCHQLSGFFFLGATMAHVYRCQPESLQDLMSIADDCSEHGQGNVQKGGHIEHLL